MKLFVFPHAAYSRKVLIAAYEKDVKFDEEQIVPPFDLEAMARLRREQHPLATVPLLRLDDGRYLTDSTTIVEYLDLRWPSPRMVPVDSEDALEVRRLDRLFDPLIDA